MTNARSLNRRLDRLDGGAPLDCEHMSDAQLDRLITRDMTPAQREKYTTGTADEIEAVLAAIIGADNGDPSSRMYAAPFGTMR